MALSSTAAHLEGVFVACTPPPLWPPLLQLLDELQVLNNRSEDLDVSLIDKKIDQVREQGRGRGRVAGGDGSSIGGSSIGGSSSVGSSSSGSSSAAGLQCLHPLSGLCRA